MISNEQIRKRIIEAITQSGLTQTEIAKRIGVCQQTIASYLDQNKTPSVDTLANLCKELDLDANYILCIE